MEVFCQTQCSNLRPFHGLSTLNLHQRWFNMFNAKAFALLAWIHLKNLCSNDPCGLIFQQVKVDGVNVKGNMFTPCIDNHHFVVNCVGMTHNVTFSWCILLEIALPPLWIDNVILPSSDFVSSLALNGLVKDD
jgi:hypothetical protein